MVQHTTHSFVQLQWLIDYYKRADGQSLKTIVFCNNIEDTRKLYRWALDQLEAHGMAYQGCSKQVENRIVDMYHSHVSAKCNLRIQSEFHKETSVIRLLFSTIKMGMGVDVPDIDMVVIFGVPSNVIDLWQEIGRCARRPCRTGLAAIYVTGKSLSLSKDPCIQELARPNQCFRKAVLKAFQLTEGEIGSTEQSGCHGKCANKICNCKLCSCCNHCAEACICANKMTAVHVLSTLPHCEEI